MLHRRCGLPCRRQCPHEQEGEAGAVGVTSRQTSQTCNRSLKIPVGAPFFRYELHCTSIAPREASPFGLEPIVEVGGAREMKAFQDVTLLQLHVLILSSGFELLLKLNRITPEFPPLQKQRIPVAAHE